MATWQGLTSHGTVLSGILHLRYALGLRMRAMTSAAEPEVLGPLAPPGCLLRLRDALALHDARD